MNKFQKIKQVIEIFPNIYKDNRGYFFESYNKKNYINYDINCNFIQDNISKSSKNILRGLHFQKKYAQDKLLYCVSGKIFDVVVDLRNESPDFGKYQTFLIDSEKNNQLFIPKGFAHGFLTLSDTNIISYKCSEFYHPEEESGIIWNDSTLKIDWALNDILPVLSEKDKKLPNFDYSKKYFDINGNWIGN